MPVRYASTQGSINAALGTTADVANLVATKAIVSKTGATTALTAAEVITSGIIRQSGTNGALSVQLPTASAMAALIPNFQTGSVFQFVILNTNDATLTLTTNTGLTLAGTTAVPTNKSQIYLGVVTNDATPAITILGILFAPS